MYLSPSARSVPFSNRAGAPERFSIAGTNLLRVFCPLPRRTPRRDPVAELNVRGRVGRPTYYVIYVLRARTETLVPRVTDTSLA